MIQYIAKSIKRAGRDEKGFTLVELMAVLAVLAIIAAIAVPRFTATMDAAREKADQATLDVLQRAVDQYMIDNPEDTDGPEKSDLEDGKYIEGTWPTPEVKGKEFKLSGTSVTYENSGS